MAGFMWLGLGGPTHKTVCWHADSAGVAVTVECNGNTFSTDQYGASTVTATANANNVAVRVSGLSPDTQYPFVVKENGVAVYTSTGGRHTIRPDLVTHPVVGTRWKVIWGSCMQAQPEWLSTPMALVNDPLVRVAVFCGDVPYCDDNPNTFWGVVCPDVTVTPLFASWSAWYEAWHRNPKIQHMLRVVELVRSANDHEYYNSFDPSIPMYVYKDIMKDVARAWQVGNPRNVDSGIDTGALYTRFTTGPIEHFLLDTQTYKGLNGTDSTMLEATQLAWLLTRLSSSASAFKAIQSGYTWTHSDHPDAWYHRTTELGTINNYINNNNITTTFWPGGDYHAQDVAHTASPWRMNINSCPMGVGTLHSKLGYELDCVYKIAGNADISTPVRYGYGELDIAADWQSVAWALKTADYGDVLIDGVFVAGRNEWGQRQRTVAYA